MPNTVILANCFLWEEFAMDDLISVIIPVYKVEPYLLRCVHSVMEQSYRNLEIILVDDGSPDNCGKMCDALAEKDTRIKVYHKENGGLSDARNFGVEQATGKYITFIDSDDYIAEDYIEYLHALLSENSADISCCPMSKTYGDVAEYKSNENLPRVQLLTGKEACYQLFNSKLYLTLVTAWGKLYKSEIVKQYPFPKGRVHEDEATTCKYYYASQTVAVGNRCLYAYFQNPAGIMNADPDGRKPDFIWAVFHRAQFFEEQNEPEIAQKAWSSFFTLCVRDSLSHDGRSDIYLKDFPRGKTLSKNIVFRYRVYSFSKTLYKLMIKILALLRR